MADCTEQYMWIDFPGYEWVESELIGWGVCTDVLLRQIFNDSNYVYAVTTSGLDIIDIESENRVAYISNEGGFSTVWANEKTVYFGTDSDGIKYIEKSCIPTSSDNLIDIGYCLNDFNYSFNVSDNQIKYIHGNNKTLAVVNYYGIDVLNNEPGFGFKSSTQNSDVEKCFLTSKRELYYTENINYPAVYKVNNVICDWSESDVNYIIKDKYLEEGIFMKKNVNINDIYVTVDTSIVDSKNTLFLATSSGVFIYDEGNFEYDVYLTN